MESQTALAKIIRQHAREVIEDHGIGAAIRKQGQLYFTGSYALDLMTWNDIDMQLLVKENLLPIEALSTILKALSPKKEFVEGRLINFTGDYKPHMPRGTYLGMIFNFPELGGNWKLDLWSLQMEDFEHNRRLIEKLRGCLDKQTRELILEAKHQLKGSAGRMPKMASHWLYQAVLLEKLTEKRAIYKFLQSKGVNLEHFAAISLSQPPAPSYD